MKDCFTLLCTVGYTHKIRVFVNINEDIVLLRLINKKRQSVAEFFITCPKKLEIFINRFADHLINHNLSKLDEIQENLQMLCHKRCGLICNYEERTKNRDESDKRYGLIGILEFFILCGLRKTS